MYLVYAGQCITSIKACLLCVFLFLFVDGCHLVAHVARLVMLFSSNSEMCNRVIVLITKIMQGVSGKTMSQWLCSKVTSGFVQK